ncbi:MAG TPA: PD-(D/E)XK nuclease family protein [Candidatus Binatia bacterium]|jgi:ATP-dependent helicase/nuclease subunit B
MQILLGPFHPYLEDALVEEIIRLKRDNALAPVLLLVPSNTLRRRLKILLSRERRLNFINLHMLTFFQLSRRLLEERYGGQPPPLQENGQLEEVLRETIRMKTPGAEAFTGLEEKAGGAGALWQTIRDLKDGSVDPATALEAARAGLFEESTESVEALLNVYQTFLTGLENWNLRDYADLDLLALEQVAASGYLRSFERILYYGFYDLTQVQLDVFLAVARRYPVTTFFPLLDDGSKHPAWTFAARFYERYIHGLAGSDAPRNLVANTATHLSLLPLFTEESPGPSHVSAKHVPIKVLSCFGAREEIDTAAKEILRLVAEEGYAFDEIGIAARSLEPYRPWIEEIFTPHRISFTLSAEPPLAEHPLAKAAVLLLNLPLKNYVRTHVIDLLDSPFFNAGAATNDGDGRPDLWDLASRLLGIGKGADEWSRLEKYLVRGIAVAEDDDRTTRREIVVPAHQVRMLRRIFSELHGDLDSVPREATWSRYVNVWAALQKKWLAPDGNSAAAFETIDDALQRLAALDAVCEKVPLAHFLETYQRRLERGSLPQAQPNSRSVAVLDAMAARGSSFRAVFIVGLNEGMFPRTIREDAFLRDRERELFETVLGYKVATKLGGFDEERLLFTLLVGSAKERLYGLHARNDGDGRPLAPSWYVEELCRAAGDRRIEYIDVPRSHAEKAGMSPFDRVDLVPPEELAVRLTLTGKDPKPLIDLCLPAPSLYTRGREALHRLEESSAELGEYDGIVKSAGSYWARAAASGLSPTSLEAYARCPFQFFARNLLGLERLERPEDFEGPVAAEMGLIVHEVLRSFYQELLDAKYFDAAASRRKPDKEGTLRAAARKAFVAFERDNAVGYLLAWEILKEQIETLLVEVVNRDLADLEASGYRPLATEHVAEVKLQEDWPAPLNGALLHGRMDRIDYDSNADRMRIVDYKLKLQRSRSSADNDLLRSALRAQRLQPPFYALLGKKASAEFHHPEASVGVAFYFLAPAWDEGPLAVESIAGDVCDGASGAALKANLAFLAESMRGGRFFILPGDHCRYCQVSEVCRKQHLPTLWRAEADATRIAHIAVKKTGVLPCP